MRLSPIRPDPRGLPPIRSHEKPGCARDALQMVPAPRSRPADVITWILVGFYVVLAVGLIWIGAR